MNLPCIAGMLLSRPVTNPLNWHAFQNFNWSTKRLAQLEAEAEQLLGQAAKHHIQLDVHAKYTLEQLNPQVDDQVCYVKLLLEKQVGYLL